VAPLQNGIAKHSIGFITQVARTILAHAISKWPGAVTKEFRLFAEHHACTF
jgi:hypothetical protein